MILQLAIQGKLTADWRKRDPDLVSGENDARELLEEIKTERSLSIAKNKIPSKSLSNTHGKIPEEWTRCRLGEIISISSGNGLTKNNMNSNEPFPSTAEMELLDFMINQM